MLAMVLNEQLSLFPKPSKLDVLKTRVLLKDYVKKVKELNACNSADSVKKLEIEIYKEMLRNVEKAVGLITDEEIRAITHYRFILGFPRQGVLYKFSLITERTVDRKIAEGVETVADTLKLWGVL